MFHPDYINPKKLIVNEDILKLFKLVEKHGGVLRFVGGAVRDAIAGFERANIDLVTDLSPSEFSDMCDDEGLRCVPIGIQFFTIGVMVNSSFFKVTSLSPEEDNIKDEWKTDASKRDLTINAVYADEKGNVFDYYNGIKDLENGVLRSIGDPNIRFREDPVRMLRAIRLSARLDFKIHSDSLKAIAKHGDEILQASKPRIFEETMRLFAFSKAEKSFRKLWDSKLMAKLLPEIEEYLKISGGKKSDLWNFLAAFDKLNVSYNTEDKQARTFISDVALKMSSLIAPIYFSQVSPSASIEERYELANQLILEY